ncbi:hypothetical protein GALMADRAFT_249650 [Galerina marginata CBS 339.88]|uniref:Uncharacterized protein n=1 Tax=Galerina marginata (strain CBS 339.88) TaxID=685588 RepID=A0A067T493_GALM3|nr:hypothetical protein GALMADRAFT_249650 [Galerina marginata CBS 339.88]
MFVIDERNRNPQLRPRPQPLHGTFRPVDVLTFIRFQLSVDSKFCTKTACCLAATFLLGLLFALSVPFPPSEQASRLE